MSDSDFPVFDPQGNLLGNLTGNQGQIPSNSGLTGSTLGSGIQGGTLSTPGATSLPSAPTTSSPTRVLITGGTVVGGPQSGSLADYFARAIIIVLGFIFIAVGLNMLRPGTVPLPGRRG